MALRQTAADGLALVSAEDVQRAVSAPGEPFRLDTLLPQTPKEMHTREDVNGGMWIERDDLLRLLGWYAPSASAEHSMRIGGVLRALQVDAKAKRAVARKHRWMIAFRQKYMCATCNMILHPKAFEIDHIRPLSQSGADDFDPNDASNDNLQALCSLCHAKKTRTRG